MKIKLIVGFRRDQEHTIDADEAHKAYYLFLHPENRSVFNNGLAIKGDQIQEIVPDYVATMGWNPGYLLMSDDWEVLNKSGITKDMQRIMAAAKEIAQLGEQQDLNIPLSQLLKEKYPQLSESRENRGVEMKRIGEIKS